MSIIKYREIKAKIKCVEFERKEIIIMMNTMTTPRFEITVNPEIMDVKWGDVVFVDFTDNSRDSEQSGIRPAIIIQNDKGNEHSPTTIVASITSQEKRYLPTHVVVKPYQSGLNKVSTILMEQVRTIDKSRILSKVGHIETDWLKEKIKKSLTISFGVV